MVMLNNQMVKLMVLMLDPFLIFLLVAQRISRCGLSSVNSKSPDPGEIWACTRLHLRNYHRPGLPAEIVGRD